MEYVRKDAENDYVIADDAGRIISRHSCRDWADQALHVLLNHDVTDGIPTRAASEGDPGSRDSVGERRA